MSLTKETKWLCEHAKVLEKYSGQWILFDIQEGVLSSGPSIDHLMAHPKKVKGKKEPFIFHVPSKDDLLSPLI